MISKLLSSSMDGLEEPPSCTRRNTGEVILTFKDYQALHAFIMKIRIAGINYGQELINGD